MAAMDVDCLALSGHKMYAPFGAGALVVRTELVADAEPLLAGGGAGDNPRYIDGIADVVAKNHVLYQSYFFSTDGGVGMLLTGAPQSFAEYKVRFVGG